MLSDKPRDSGPLLDEFYSIHDGRKFVMLWLEANVAQDFDYASRSAHYQDAHSLLCKQDRRKICFALEMEVG
jgi:hypothetical protein